MLQAPALFAIPTLADARDCDALVIVTSTPALERLRGLGESVVAAFQDAARLDASLGQGGKAPALLPAPGCPGSRVVLASVGALDREVDDARLIAEATNAAVARAVEAGARRPALAVLVPDDARFARAREVAALAALGSAWAPLEAREAGRAPDGIAAVSVVGLDATRVARLVALERGRCLARDITGTEPERMAPLQVAELCKGAFVGTPVSVAVDEDVARYPLLAAVARASMLVPRHRPCVVRLDLGPVDAPRTIVLCGKGVTYDTGGADLKTHGAMAGMSRDKGGAGAVAGLVRALAEDPPAGVRVIGLLGMVRNSIGEESFVSDEIIDSRAGVRVRIGNTDAEGRLVLADLLSEAAEILDGKDGVALSVATLTGHVYRALGPYVGALGNAAARDAATLPAIAALGELYGEPMEVERPRREDYALVAPKSVAEDLMSSNRLASVDTPRGHQFPFAFLDLAARLTKRNVAFGHLDIGGAAMSPADWQAGRPTGAPVLALASWLHGER
jgi:leucyl aminopeptidase